MIWSLTRRQVLVAQGCVGRAVGCTEGYVHLEQSVCARPVGGVNEPNPKSPP
jgi:hypothetical protein